MSLISKSTASGVRPAPTPAEAPASSVSPGVDVRIQGWREGLNKVPLTKTFRAGGVNLSAAVRPTGQVLDGEEVHVRLCQFADFQSARTKLDSIGVRHIRVQ